MPEKPEIKDELIIDCLRDEYGLGVKDISSLSLGADVDTSVYRVTGNNETNYFVKLRRGNFSEASVTIPNYLSASGVKQVIPALATERGQLWANIDPFKVILYPFVKGQAGLDIRMSRQQWFEFGTALQRFHTADFPEYLTYNIQIEDFSSRWRKAATRHLEQIEGNTMIGPIQVDAAHFLKSKKAETLEIVRRAEQLALMLQKERPEFILCHSDVHGYNLLVDNNGALYIVDWDGLIFAPKERDLMFVGGGHGNSGYPPQQEEAMFYQGYGETKINQTAIAYYRYERIILDIVDDCDLIFWSDEREEVQAAALEDLKNKFLPDLYVAIAYQSDKVSKN
jgi:spectinomycin phosphotransferase